MSKRTWFLISLLLILILIKFNIFSYILPKGEKKDMEILFLGTGGGEFHPSIFCNCPICNNARIGGRQNLWFNSSILIDNQYLVDAPTGLSLNMALFKINVKFPFYIFISHSHQDHFDPQEIIGHRDDNTRKIYLYINKTIFELLKNYTKFNRFFNFDKQKNCFVNIVKPFELLKINEEATVMPVLANHDRTYNEENLNYILNIKGRTILYASDTGWYSEKTWEEIEKHHYDVIILECTGWKNNEPIPDAKLSWMGHMTLWSFLKFHERITKKGLLKPSGKFFATHVAHLNKSKLVKTLSKYKIQVAYDGLKIKI
ncbi:MAG: MBL fold metallo-hydrolase [Elusimicrobia bacterium]|nr:MBL fold metallo-hydrolase [Elusimicrobiota bacterium]